MAKYMVLYSSALSASELMNSASSDQMQASMAEWMQWKEEADKLFSIEFGLPLQPVGKATQAGLEDSNSRISGYSMVETDDKDQLMESLKSHPHLKREVASIDVFELLHMPGLDA